MMKILIVEPFYTDSHKAWLDGLIQHSSHDIEKLSLPGFHWKWRMHGAAITLAKQYKLLAFRPDLIICTDMIDLAVFTSLLRKELVDIPVLLYFHENQLSYPWSPLDKDVELKRDRHYAFINYTSSVAADFVLFNSHYHRHSFIGGLVQFLNAFPDFKNLDSIRKIEAKSEVLPLGLELSKYDPYINSEVNVRPIILWNHRWEYDKNPSLFFNTLLKCKAEGLDFNLLVLGKKYPTSPEIFEMAKKELADSILHWGYAEKWEDYAKLLRMADILPVTSIQDFFGISVVEGIYCGATPLLPDRLAYPEHLKGKANFYSNEDELFSKLKALILQHPIKPKIDLEKIKSYDWSQQILSYDATFSKLSANFAGN